MGDNFDDIPETLEHLNNWMEAISNDIETAKTSIKRTFSSFEQNNGTVNVHALRKNFDHIAQAIEQIDTDR